MTSSNSSTNKLPFMTCLNISIKNIPKYPAFEGIFTETVDKTLCGMIMEKTDIFSQETIHGFNKAVMDKMRATGELNVKHNQRHGLGRFYADNNTSLIPHPRGIKHTLFSYGKWLDLDMIKGHPTIALEVFGGLLDLPSIKEYVDSFDTVVNTLVDFYKTESVPLDVDNIKWLFNMMLYGGTPDGWKSKIALGSDGYIGKNIIDFKEHHPLVISFEKECLKMSDMIFKHNPAIANKVRKPSVVITETPISKKNAIRDTKNSTISYFFQIIENHIVYLVYGLLVELGYITPRKCGLEYDGLNIPPNGTVIDREQTTRVINEYVFNKTGLNIKFKFKQYGDSVMTELIEIRETMTVAVPIDDVIEAIVVVEEKEDTSQEKFNEMVVNFEKSHLKIVSDGLYVRTTDDGYYTMTRQQLLTSYEHIQCGVNPFGTPVSFINKWINCNDKINRKDTMDIYPNSSKCPATAFNLWRPFTMEKVAHLPFTKNENGLKQLLDHYKVMCDYDEITYKYVIGWMAHTIQKPDIKLPCLTFVGNQGAGKTTIIISLQKMMGEKKVLEITDPTRDVWGAFNSIMMDSFIINLSEIGFADSKNDMGKFKALITDGTININQKGVKQITVASYHKWIVTTNNPNPFKLTKDDRRFAMIRSSDDKIGDTKYFNNLYSLLNDNDVVRTLYSYLKSYDLTVFKATEIPQTELLEGMKTVSTSPVEDWLKDLTVENMNTTTPVKMTSKVVYKKFRDWLDGNDRTYDTNIRSLGMKLTNLRIKGVSKGGRDNYGDETKAFDFQMLKIHFNIGKQEPPNNIVIVEPKKIKIESKSIFKVENVVEEKKEEIIFVEDGEDEDEVVAPVYSRSNKRTVPITWTGDLKKGVCHISL